MSSWIPLVVSCCCWLTLTSVCYFQGKRLIIISYIKVEALNYSSKMNRGESVSEMKTCGTKPNTDGCKGWSRGGAALGPDGSSCCCLVELQTPVMCWSVLERRVTALFEMEMNQSAGSDRLSRSNLPFGWFSDDVIMSLLGLGVVGSTRILLVLVPLSDAKLTASDWAPPLPPPSHSFTAEAARTLDSQ